MNKKHWALGAALALCASQAFAWMALAYGDDNYTFISYNNASADEARETALKGCSKHTSGCRINWVGNGGALVLAKGEHGYASASGADPIQASNQALAICRKRRPGCQVTQAVWDTGAGSWAGVAKSRGYTHVSVNNSSREEMERDAVASCTSEGSAPCTLVEEYTRGEKAVYVFADANDTSQLAVAPDEKSARRLALRMCDQAKRPNEGACKVTEVFWNGLSAEPASMKQVLALIQRGKAVQVPQRVISNTTSSNVLRCSNECYNGSCVRTFEDGRKERWQAPRKYDPFTQNWGWDTTTNACGG